VKVHPNGAQNGIEPVPFNPAETVAVQTILSFQMPDPRLNRRSSFHPPPQALGGSPSVAFVNMDLNFSRLSMPPVVHVHKGMLGVFTGNPLDLPQSIFQCMTVIGVTVYGYGTDKPPAQAGAATMTLQPNSYRLCALPLLMHSTCGS
jgi:hypothetical protein